MSAKQIEYQVIANQKETKQILFQLSQMDVSNPKYQQLTDRLNMLNRSQGYWSNEYSKITGKGLIAQVTKTVSPIPTPVPPVNQTTTSPTSGNWQAMRNNIRNSLFGNPNSIRVENYLNSLEANANGGVPVISGNVVFGNAKKSGGGDIDDTDYNGSEMIGLYHFSNSETIILLENGVVWKPGTDISVLFYNHSSAWGSPKPPPRIEVSGTDLSTTLNAMGKK